LGRKQHRKAIRAVKRFRKWASNVLKGRKLRKQIRSAMQALEKCLVGVSIEGASNDIVIVTVESAVAPAFTLHRTPNPGAQGVVLILCVANQPTIKLAIKVPTSFHKVAATSSSFKVECEAAERLDALGAKGWGKFLPSCVATSKDGVPVLIIDATDIVADVFDVCFTKHHLRIRDRILSDISGFYRQVLGLLCILHDDAGVCHSDIKLENILVKKLPSGKLRFYLIDFSGPNGRPAVDAPVRPVYTREFISLDMCRCGGLITSSNFDKVAKANDHWALAMSTLILAMGNYPSALLEKGVALSPRGAMPVESSEIYVLGLDGFNVARGWTNLLTPKADGEECPLMENVLECAKSGALRGVKHMDKADNRECVRMLQPTLQDVLGITPNQDDHDSKKRRKRCKWE